MRLSCSADSGTLDRYWIFLLKDIFCVRKHFFFPRDIKRGKENEINIETEEQNKRRNEERDWHRSSPSGALPRQQGEALIS